MLKKLYYKISLKIVESQLKTLSNDFHEISDLTTDERNILIQIKNENSIEKLLSLKRQLKYYYEFKLNQYYEYNVW